MKIRLHNNDSTDHVDYEGTLDEIQQQAKTRIRSEGWNSGWSEVLEK